MYEFFDQPTNLEFIFIRLIGSRGAGHGVFPVMGGHWELPLCEVLTTYTSVHQHPSVNTVAGRIKYEQREH